MAGFDDLIPACDPYMQFDDLDKVAGNDWEWEYFVTDDGGDAIPWTTGYTGLCKIKNADGSTVVTPAVTFPAAGKLKLTVDNATTESLTAGQRLWEVEVARAGDGKKLPLVGGYFRIRKEVAD